MIPNSQPTKNTLLKNAQANAKAIFSREYFFFHPRRNSNYFSPNLRCFNFFCQRTVQTWTDIASNVNRLGQSVCGLETVVLRGKSRASANSTYKKLAVQWLNEALCFVSSFVVADSFRLRNRQLLVAANR